MTSASRVDRAGLRGSWALVAVGLVGAVVAASAGVYARLHEPTGQALFTLGFSGMLPMKVWLTTVVAVLALVQLLTALSMWGRLRVRGRTPSWAAPVHRWTGTLAFLVSLPVGYHCIWSLGFLTGTPRTLVHGIAGCLFYGAFAAKMLALRVRRLPGWALPVLGGTVLTAVVLLWTSAALWYLTQPGVALR